MRVALTLLALGAAWPAWQGAGWLQQRAGLEWLGLVFPGMVMLLAYSLAARLIDRP